MMIIGSFIANDETQNKCQRNEWQWINWIFVYNSIGGKTKKFNIPWIELQRAVRSLNSAPVNLWAHQFIYISNQGAKERRACVKAEAWICLSLCETVQIVGHCRCDLLLKRCCGEMWAETAHTNRHSIMFLTMVTMSALTRLPLICMWLFAILSNWKSLFVLLSPDFK